MKTHLGWAYPDADEFMCREMTADGRYQSSHLDAAMAHVTDRRIACDGGAHVGTWSRLLAGFFDRVIAVEPADDTFDALSVNMRRFEASNVDLMHVALGRSHGFVSMAIDGKPAAQKNTGGRHVEPGGTIPCQAIDDWRLLSLGFLKLDVEGSEVAALEGAALTLTRCKPIVLFEDKGFWTRYGYKRDAPQTLLLSLGYQHLQRVGHDEIWGPAS